MDEPRASTSLYAHEEGSEELLHAVFDADEIAIPVVGDTVSFVRASATGSLDDGGLEYRESDPRPPRYVVTRREITYLQVEYELADRRQHDEIVSEIHLYVRELGPEPDGDADPEDPQ